MISNAEERVRRQLGPKESLLWSGQPVQGLAFQGADLGLILFGILWTTVSGGAFVASLRTTEPDAWLLRAFLVPFVAAGLYLLIGRFWIDIQRRKRTFYGVTDERVLIPSTFLRRSLRSVDLMTLSELALYERSDGCGTITFGPSPFPAFVLADLQIPGMVVFARMFERIPEAASVYRTIRDAQRASRP